MPKTKPDQMTIARKGLLASRDATENVVQSAPTARKLVTDYFGCRPLVSVELVITTPYKITTFAKLSQGTAADVPADVIRQHHGLGITAKPRDLLAVTVIAPKNTVRILLNSSRLRRLPQQIGETLVWAFIEVDQLCRKGGFERRIAQTRHEMGIHVLPAGQVRHIVKTERALEAEAWQVTGKIMGTVQRTHAKAEAAAERRAAEQMAPPPSLLVRPWGWRPPRDV
jgi:hypothetical protein